MASVIGQHRDASIEPCELGVEAVGPVPINFEFEHRVAVGDGRERAGEPHH